MAKNMDIYGANLKSLSAKDSIKDNEKIEINQQQYKQTTKLKRNY